MIQQVIGSVFRRNFNEIRYKPFLNVENITLDYCHSTNGKDMGSILLDLFAAGLRKHSNLFQGCPISGILYMRNYVPDLANVPFIVPAGEFKLHWKVYTQNSTMRTDIGDVIGFVTLKSM